MAKKHKTSLVKADSTPITVPGYREFLNELKEKIRNDQLNWELGKDIVEKQEKEG